MHSTAVGNSGIPAFLVKLWKLVEDPAFDDLISWNSLGISFFIRNQQRFSREVLPLYFKHNNMASFIRQLNMYGFKKVVNVESGGLRMEKDEMEFQHPCFLKGNINLLECIKRKVPLGKKPTEEMKSQPEMFDRMLYDVSALQGKQDSFNSKLDSMKRENEALWREIASLRQQHMKQQQIVNKLIQFLMSLVQPNRGLGVGLKRKMPLMLNSSSHSDSKRNRLARTISFDSSNSDDKQRITASSGVTYSPVPKAGPVIHDITDCVDVETFLNSETGAPLSAQNEDSSFSTVEPIVDSPGPSNGTDKGEESSLSNTALEAVSGVDFVDHIDIMQTELEALREMLSSSGCTIDTSTLLGLFSSDDGLNKTLSDMGDYGKFPGGSEIIGNEVAQFNNGILGLDGNGGDGFSQNDGFGLSATQPSDKQPAYDYVAVPQLDEGDPEGTDIAIVSSPLSTDLTLSSDFDFLVESPTMIGEDVTMSPGRRKESDVSAST